MTRLMKTPPLNLHAPLITLFALVVWLAASATASAQPNDLATIRSQFRQYTLSKTMGKGDRLLDNVGMPKSKIAEAKKDAATLRPAGSWVDIKYDSKAHSAWPPANHLVRILSMTTFAVQPNIAAADRAMCMSAIHRGLMFWARHDFQCRNWWYNDIGDPKLLGTIGILLGDQLAPAERAYITNVSMARCHVGSMTGQNRVWIAGNGLMRGLLSNDPKLVKQAADVIWSEVRVGTDEGIQPDDSFRQHGPQQQFGNYGLAFASEVCQWAYVLRGTSVAMPEAKLSILRNYLLGGQDWVTWRGSMDISSCGRQLFPNSPKGKARGITAVMATMPLVDPSHAKQYEAFVTRNTHPDASNDLLGNKYFWNSDYAVQRGRLMFISVRMHSRRTIGGEVVNHENLSGALLADGGTFVYLYNNEYTNIFPVWNWRKIPGITAEQSDTRPKWARGKYGQPKSKSAFVGGVSNGQLGCCAMDLKRAGLSAKKVWFFYLDRVICLGADIRCTDDKPVSTTIDQCLLRGSTQLLVYLGRGTSIASRTLTGNSVEKMDYRDSILQNGIRYINLTAQPWTVTAGSQSGTWSNVYTNPSTPKGIVTKPVLTITIDHGMHPAGASYAYSESAENDRAAAAEKMLANTPSLQAVDNGEGLISAIFWTPGHIDTPAGVLKVDHPCAMLIDTHGRKIVVADPTQTLHQIGITWHGRTQQVDLPEGGDAGESVSLAWGS